jgi:hypothetical protein
MRELYFVYIYIYIYKHTVFIEMLSSVCQILNKCSFYGSFIVLKIYTNKINECVFKCNVQKGLAFSVFFILHFNPFTPHYHLILVKCCTSISTGVGKCWYINVYKELVIQITFLWKCSLFVFLMINNRLIMKLAFTYMFCWF